MFTKIKIIILVAIILTVVSKSAWLITDLQSVKIRRTQETRHILPGTYFKMKADVEMSSAHFLHKARMLGNPLSSIMVVGSVWNLNAVKAGGYFGEVILMESNIQVSLFFKNKPILYKEVCTWCDCLFGCFHFLKISSRFTTCFNSGLRSHSKEWS